MISIAVMTKLGSPLPKCPKEKDLYTMAYEVSSLGDRNGIERKIGLNKETFPEKVSCCIDLTSLHSLLLLKAYMNL